MQCLLAGVPPEETFYTVPYRASANIFLQSSTVYTVYGDEHKMKPSEATYVGLMVMLHDYTLCVVENVI